MTSDHIPLSVCLPASLSLSLSLFPFMCLHQLTRHLALAIQLKNNSSTLPLLSFPITVCLSSVCLSVCPSCLFLSYLCHTLLSHLHSVLSLPGLTVIEILICSWCVEDIHSTRHITNAGKDESDLTSAQSKGLTASVSNWCEDGCVHKAVTGRFEASDCSTLARTEASQSAQNSESGGAVKRKRGRPRKSNSAAKLPTLSHGSCDGLGMLCLKLQIMRLFVSGRL